MADYVRTVRGGFIGLAIGDALGVPVELYTHEQIMAVTQGRGVTEYLEPSLTRVKDTQGLPKGSTSDDTQLARVVARSLIRCQGFNLHDQGLALVEEFERSKFGWGGTTKAAATAIKQWRDSGGKSGRHPEAITAMPRDERSSNGSGPAMKLFPLAAFDLIGRDVAKAESLFIAHAMDLGLQTHGDKRACIASVALGYAIAAFAAPSPVGEIPSAFRERVSREVLTRTLRAESMYRFFRPAQTPPFSTYLGSALALLDVPEKLRKEINTGFRAIESVPFSIATALRHPDDFRAALVEGVSAGQDADTIGAMVGAMVGSRVGMHGIPNEWVLGLRDAGSITFEATQLALVSCGQDPNDAKRIVPPWLKGETH